MNKRFLIGLIVSLLSANQSFAVPGSFINLPSNWNNAGFCNLFNSLPEVLADLENSTEELNNQQKALDHLYNQLPENISQRNKVLDCVKSRLVEEYNCVNRCNETVNDLNNSYNELVSKISSDKENFQSRIDDLNNQIQTLGNMLNTFDNATSETALQTISQLETIKQKYEEQEALRSKLEESMMVVKGAIDSLARDDYSTQVQNQLSDKESKEYVGLSC